MVTKLNYPARIALENEDHSTPDLGGRHCHMGKFQNWGLKHTIGAWL
jgi:hypothetical protein